MRILYIIARLNIGGTTPPVVNAIAGLRARGHIVELICGNVAPTEGDMLYYARERNVTPTVIPALGREINPLADVRVLFALIAAIHQFKPDLVHTHTAKAGLLGRIAAWVSGVPSVHTFHGHVFSGYSSGYAGRAKTLFYLTLERVCALISRRLIAVSEQVRHDLTAVYKVAASEKVVTIPYGFPLDHLANARQGRAAFRAAYEIPEHAYLIGIVGRLVPVKNHTLLIRAFAQIHEMRPQTHDKQPPQVYLAIIGDGELRTVLEAQVAILPPTVRDRVRFCGWIQDTAHIFSGLDLLALTSLNEGLPVTIIEAMAAGVRIVATRVGGCTQLLEANNNQYDDQNQHPTLGRLVESNDDQGLARALLASIDHPTPVDSATLQAVARQNYGLASYIDRLATVYRATLSLPEESV